MRRILVLLLLVAALNACATRQEEHRVQPAPATRPDTSPNISTEGDQVDGQTIYVPVYSHIYMRDKTRVINLTATLSIRNTDALHSIRINAARYYGTDGTLVREYITTPLGLAPMASTDFVVAEDDTAGGVGANFIVEWSAAVDVTSPVVEAVMISTASQQGISFISEGRVISDRAKSVVK